VLAHRDALRNLRAGAPSATFNCGYGHGFSVREVIEAVKRASGVDFKVETAPRRAGDPAQIVADSALIRKKLQWQPRFDDLSKIVSDALAWERHLMERRDGMAGARTQMLRA
jgi:UDP-glucose 4-epimerase